MEKVEDYPSISRQHPHLRIHFLLNEVFIMPNQREAFSSKLGFILSAIGFAIGMGTFWRFPYLAGQNGGALFLMLYVIAMLVIALPLFAVEISMGSKSRKDAVGAYKALAPGKPWYINGYVNVLTMTLIIGSTLPIGSWVIIYCIRAITGAFVGLTPDEMQAFYDDKITNNLVEVIFWVLAVIGVMSLILKNSLDKGLEIANRVCIPSLFFILVILCIRSVTLPGAEAGISFFLTPDFSKITGEVALLAVGQAFYAVGVAMAVSIVFGSYMKDCDKQIVKNTLAVGAGIIGAAFLAGLLIFPSVFAFNQAPDAGPHLIFITMPNIFDQMPFGRIVSVFFYILFFLAAFSTWMAGYEAMIATLRDQFKMTRSKAVMVAGVIIAFFAVLSASYGGFLLLTDKVVGYLLTIGALVAAIFSGWFWKLDTFFEEANIHSPQVKKVQYFLVKYLIPLVVIILLLEVMGVFS